MKTKFLIICTLIAGQALLSNVEARNLNAPRVNLGSERQTLKANEIDTLLWMREEEKLARDVYLSLQAPGNPALFARIALSEQRHFDAMGNRISQYGLADSALPVAGAFTQPELQALFQQLTSQSAISEIQALTVGAMIEDMDIADLLAAIESTNHPILKRTYENLLEGSKNHLRAFVGALRSAGADYTPTHIDPLLFATILGD